MIDYKEIFDCVDESHKIDYDFMYSNDLETLTNFVSSKNNELFFSIFLKEGEMICEIDFTKHTLKSPAIIFLPCNTMFQLIETSKNISLTVLVSNNKARQNLLNSFSREISVNKSLKTNPWVLLDKDDYLFVSNHISDIKRIFSYTSNPYRLEALKHLLTSSFYQFFYKFYSPNNQNDYGICNHFFELLESNFIKERNSNFYAKNIGISKGHLEFIVKKKTGKTVKAWIDERLVIEAKHLLKGSSESIESIAQKMAFSSIEVFSRFFKRVAGKSPSKFRQ